MPSYRALLTFDAKAPLLFTSGQFLFWLTLFLPGLWLLRRAGRGRLAYVAVFSCFFFYKCSGPLLASLLFTAATDYVVARRIAQSSSAHARKLWLLTSLALSGGVLVYFKYTNLLFWGWAQLRGSAFQPLALIAPAGISFYTFESVSYVVDVYRGRVRPTRSFIQYLAYLSYFPHLMAGPIVRAEQLLPDLERAPELGAERLGSGLFLMLTGLLKKAVIADYLARYADTVFGGGAGLSGLELLLGVYAYTAQIYCDFSGYSELALGLGRICGVDLPVNFQAPYAATSLTEFWRRWHITLSSWLRDYVYLPLGGNRLGPQRTALNLLGTMAFGGLWHGASLSFISWGLLHGAVLCVERAAAAPLARLRARSWGSALSWLMTFHVVALLWVLFRARHAREAWQLLARIFSDFQLAHVPQVCQARGALLVTIAAGLLFGAVPFNPLERWAERFAAAPWWLRASVALAVVQLSIELRSADIQPFIYFQF